MSARRLGLGTASQPQRPPVRIDARTGSVAGLREIASGPKDCEQELQGAIQAADTLSQFAADGEAWAARASALDRVADSAEVVFSDSNGDEELRELFLTDVVDASKQEIAECILDLRSALARRACRTSAVLACTLKGSFETCIPSLIPPLIKQLGAALNIVADSAAESLSVILHWSACPSQKALVAVCEAASQSNSGVQRARLAGVLLAVVQSWPEKPLSKYGLHSVLRPVLRKLSADAGASARQRAREALRALDGKVMIDDLSSSASSSRSGSVSPSLSASSDSQRLGTIRPAVRRAASTKSSASPQTTPQNARPSARTMTRTRTTPALRTPGNPATSTRVTTSSTVGSVRPLTRSTTSSTLAARESASARPRSIVRSKTSAGGLDQPPANAGHASSSRNLKNGSATSMARQRDTRVSQPPSSRSRSRSPQKLPSIHLSGETDDGSNNANLNGDNISTEPKTPSPRGGRRAEVRGAKTVQPSRIRFDDLELDMDLNSPTLDNDDSFSFLKSRARPFESAFAGNRTTSLTLEEATSGLIDVHSPAAAKVLSFEEDHDSLFIPHRLFESEEPNGLTSEDGRVDNRLSITESLNGSFVVPQWSPLALNSSLPENGDHASDKVTEDPTAAFHTLSTTPEGHAIFKALLEVKSVAAEGPPKFAMDASSDSIADDYVDGLPDLPELPTHNEPTVRLTKFQTDSVHLDSKASPKPYSQPAGGATGTLSTPTLATGTTKLKSTPSSDGPRNLRTTTWG